MSDDVQIIQPAGSASNRTAVALSLLEKLPPEAVITIVEVFADVVRANKTMEGKDQEFQHQLVMLREKNLSRKESLALLSTLLSHPQLSQEDISIVVTAICNIAEDKSG